MNPEPHKISRKQLAHLKLMDILPMFGCVNMTSKYIGGAMTPDTPKHGKDIHVIAPPLYFDVILHVRDALTSSNWSGGHLKSVNNSPKRVFAKTVQKSPYMVKRNRF